MDQQSLDIQDFHKLTVNTLLELCTNPVNEQRITCLEGRLLVTVESGDIFELIIEETKFDIEPVNEVCNDAEAQDDDNAADLV